MRWWTPDMQLAEWSYRRETRQNDGTCYPKGNTMTNERAIEVLRTLRTGAVDSIAFYGKLHARVWKRIVKQEQEKLAAIEHAITTLSMLGDAHYALGGDQIHGKPHAAPFRPEHEL